MADPRTHFYDAPSWTFVEPLDANFMAMGDDDLLATGNVTPFGLPGWDMEPMENKMAQQQQQQQHHPAKSEFYFQPSQNYPDRASSIFTDLKTAQDTLETQDFSLDLDELLRSTSQMATERALFMTTAANTTTSTSPASMALYASPMLDPCSSPDAASHWSSSSVSDADWEREMAPFYSLPDAAVVQTQPPPQPPQQRRSPPRPPTEEMTPLEMPDGSMRFTANWLPVDPQGGFTIGPDAPPPLEYPAYAPDAFISLRAPV